MKYKILKNKRNGAFLLLAICLLGACLVTEAAAQTKRARPAPVAPVKKPAVTGTPGTGVGDANGSGVGGTTGSGTGEVSGSGLGQPSGTTTVAPNGNATGQPNGNGAGKSTGTGTGTGSGNGTGNVSGAGTGAANGNGIGVNTGSSTGGVAASTRTYIKEMNGRCYYVTPQGGKHYVERSHCALYPK